MTGMEEKIQNYAKKFRNCTTMTDLLLALSSWQSFARSNGLTQEQKKDVDQVYLEMEEKLIKGLSKTPW